MNGLKNIRIKGNGLQKKSLNEKEREDRHFDEKKVGYSENDGRQRERNRKRDKDSKI